MGFNPTEQEFVLLDKILFKKGLGSQEPEFRKSEKRQKNLASSGF
jgi:hypothetical protein